MGESIGGIIRKLFSFKETSGYAFLDRGRDIMVVTNKDGFVVLEHTRQGVSIFDTFGKLYNTVVDAQKETFQLFANSGKEIRMDFDAIDQELVYDEMGTGFFWFNILLW